MTYYQPIVAVLPTMEFVYCDGGRSQAGYNGSAGDCVVRAIGIAAELPYQYVYDELNLAAEKERPRGKRKRSSSRTGVSKRTFKKWLLKNGWTWTPTMKIGSGCKVHLRPEELPMGRLIVSVSKHMVAVVDRVIYDTHDPARGGMRCVYGYFRKDENAQV